jgi:hypothetical protein
MVRFIVVELIQPDLNLRFNVSIVYLRLIILLVVDNVHVLVVGCTCVFL